MTRSVSRLRRRRTRRKCLRNRSPCRQIRQSPILHRLRQENPDKTFHPVNERLVCPNMKKTTLDNLLEGLREMKTRVTVPEEVAVRAKRAIDAMLAIG